MGETCKTALIRREICIGWNDNRCWQSGRDEQEICVTAKKGQKTKDVFEMALAEKCKPFRRGMGPSSLSYKGAWLCEWKKK